MFHFRFLPAVTKSMGRLTNAFAIRLIPLFSITFLSLSSLVFLFHHLTQTAIANEIIDGQVVRADFPASFIYPKSSVTQLSKTNVTWKIECEFNYIDVVGVGLGDASEAFLPGSITLKKPENIRWLLAQFSGRFSNNQGNPLPDYVIFSDSNGSLITVTEAFTSTAHGYSFYTLVSPTGNVTTNAMYALDKTTYAQTARGFVVYANYETDQNWTSIGKLTNDYIYGGIPAYSETTHVVQLPEKISSPTDLQISAVVIDNQNDHREMILIANAGKQFASVSEPGYTHGKLLNITDLMLYDVINTDKITLTLQSPAQTGDSLILIGYNLRYRCDNDSQSHVFLPFIFLDNDLTLSLESSDKPAIVGFPFFYTITITNNGSSQIHDVEVSLDTDSNLKPVITSISQGTCYTDPEMICKLGGMAPRKNVTIYLEVTPTFSGTFTNVISAKMQEVDRNPQNNIVTDSLNVIDDPYLASRCDGVGNEPNNEFAKAQGPLAPGRTYCGYLHDGYDYYTITITSPTIVSFTLHNIQSAKNEVIMIRQKGFRPIYQCCNTKQDVFSHTTPHLVKEGQVYFVVVNKGSLSHHYELTVDYIPPPPCYLARTCP